LAGAAQRRRLRLRLRLLPLLLLRALGGLLAFLWF